MLEPYRHLERLPETGWRPGGFVVEIGSQSAPATGSSTALAAVAEQLGAPFVTVDASATVREALTDAFGEAAIQADGAEFLRRFRSHISVLYLDGAELIPATEGGPADPRNAGVLLAHLDQARHALSRLTDIAVVAVDHTTRGSDGFQGKGALVVPLLLQSGFRLLSESGRGVVMGRRIHVALPPL